VSSAVTRGFVTTAAGQIHYREVGPQKAAGAPPVLFLHMTPGSSRVYAGVLARVAEAGYRAIAMDTMGYGDSDSLGDARRMEEFAQSVTWLLDGLGIERASIVGLSTGSIIAAATAIHFPARVSRLVLCEPGRFNTPERQARGYIGGRWEVDAEGESLASRWRQIAGGFGGRLTTEQAFVLYVDSLRSGEHQREAYHALIHYELIERLPRIAAPTLLLTGEHSTRVEPIVTFLDGIAGSTHEVVPDCANAPPLEQPAAFASALLAWLARTPELSPDAVGDTVDEAGAGAEVPV
jgi:pimeloyl-ACP methyl ester carboxylesterase